MPGIADAMKRLLTYPLAAFLITAPPAVHAEKELYYPPNTCRKVSCEFGVLMRSEKVHCDFIPLLREAKYEWANSHVAAMEVVLMFPEGSNLGPILAIIKEDIIDKSMNWHKKNCIKDYPPHRKLNCDLAIQRITGQDHVVSYLKEAEKEAEGEYYSIESANPGKRPGPFSAEFAELDAW